ncbi:MAG: hypothetical protein GY807_03445 [Gammaproteobacteria bacterium]|nr:hypothetical protein [Gammaproteobacteria bacterium]
MSENFDLLGDPIPEGFGKRGRPPHNPTSETRNKVMLLLALGRDDAFIASSLGITKPTLKKHYFRELRVRDEARARVDGIRVQALWNQVREGNVAAMKEFNRVMEQVDRDTAEREFGAARPEDDEDLEIPAPEKIGKKEAANRAAETAGVGTDWGEDLLPEDGRTKH